MGSFLEEDFQNPPPALRKSPYGRISNGYEASSEETDDEYPCEDMMSKQIKEEGGLNSSNNTIPSGFFDPSSSTLCSDDTPTTIRLNVPECRHRYLLLMLDMGVNINLIKKGALKDGIPLEGKSAKIAGITPDTMHTLGSVMLTIRGQPYRFHVVDDDFSIRDDGLISRNLLRAERAILNYRPF